MTHHRTPSERTRSAILSYVSQSELRGVHDFVSATQPIAPLDLATTPTPWSQNATQNGVFTDAAFVQAQPAATLDLARSRTLNPNAVAETDFVFEARLSEEEPLFQPPESWRSPSTETQTDNRWSFNKNWSWSERSTAAFLGFAAGLLIVVPMVLLLSATPGHKPLPAQEATAKPAPARPDSTPVAFANASISAGAWFDTRSTQAPRTAGQPDQSIKVVSQAHQAISEGRIDQARTLLRAAASPDAPQLWFMLAETYDPVITAQSVNVQPNSEQLRVADTNFARFYYQQALTHGVSRARARLDGLTKP